MIQLKVLCIVQLRLRLIGQTADIRRLLIQLLITGLIACRSPLSICILRRIQSDIDGVGDLMRRAHTGRHTDDRRICIQVDRNREDRSVTTVGREVLISIRLYITIVAAVEHNRRQCFSACHRDLRAADADTSAASAEGEAVRGVDTVRQSGAVIYCSGRTAQVRFIL